MKKLSLFLIFGLLVSVPVMSQVRYEGDLFITVTDEEGNPIAGAETTVTGPGYSRKQTTTDRGEIRFLKLTPGAYELQISAEGFNTQIYPAIRIDTLANVSLDIKMQRSEIVEEVIVTAETPLLNQRSMAANTVLTQEEMTQVPTARDPWAILQTIPGVTSDRINVGGDQAGQQANFTTKGDDGQQSTWTMDGVEFTDNAAEGATSSYLDFNAFDQISFVTAGADIEQATPGARLNFVQKQGSNRVTGTARLIFTDEGLQDTNSDNVTNPVTGESQDIIGNQITQIFEKNFDIGGPAIRDRLWYWAGFTQNDINILLTTGNPDVTQLRNVSLKLHGQEVQGKLTYRLFYTEGDKIKAGRTAVPNRSLETTWNQSGPSPIYSGALSYFVTPNLELSGQVGKVDGGFRLAPNEDAEQIIFDSSGTWRNTFFDFGTKRPTKQYTIRGNYFFGTGAWDHELKFGWKLRESTRNSFTKYGTDGVVGFVPFESATLYREGDFGDETEQTNVWVADTVLKGPWAINVGLHYSDQSGTQTSSRVPGNPLLQEGVDAGILPTNPIPALDYAGFDPGFTWEDLMVRAGVTYTFDWEKRLLLRANFAQYVDTLANGDVGYNNPVAPSGISYPWVDDNGDELVQVDELDLANPTGFINISSDPTKRAETFYTNQIDTGLGSPRVDEFVVGADYEVMRNFVVGLNYTYRLRTDELWSPLYNETVANPNPDTGLAQGPLQPFGVENYSCVPVTGTIPDTTRTYTQNVCFISDVTDTSGSRGTYLTNRDNYDVNYGGLELTATKRLSNRWMLRGYFMYSEWYQSLSGPFVSSQYLQAPSSSTFVVPDGDPTNFTPDAAADNAWIAFQSGGSGPTNNIWPGSSRWQFNINGMVQLPMDWQISGNLTGREGYAIPVMFTNQNTDLNTALPDADGILQAKEVQIDEFGTDRYDDYIVLDLRVAKLFRLGNTNVEVAGEVFNVFNDSTTLAVNRNVVGPNWGNIDQIISPRVLRFLAAVNF